MDSIFPYLWDSGQRNWSSTVEYGLFQQVLKEFEKYRRKRR